MRHCDIFQRPVISQHTFFNKLEKITNYIIRNSDFWHSSVQGYPPGFTTVTRSGVQMSRSWRALRLRIVPLEVIVQPSLRWKSVPCWKTGSFLHEKKLACGSIFVETLGVFFKLETFGILLFLLRTKKKTRVANIFQWFSPFSSVLFQRFKGRSAGSFCGDRLGRSDVRNCCLFGLHETGDATHSTSRRAGGVVLEAQL